MVSPQKLTAVENLSDPGVAVKKNGDLIMNFAMSGLLFPGR
jgi:hypothetical protein